MIATKPKQVENQYTRIPDHLLTAEDRVKRSIIDSLSNSITKQNIRSAFTRLINKGKATPQQAYCLLQLPITRHSHTPDSDIKLIAALRTISKGQQ